MSASPVPGRATSALRLLAVFVIGALLPQAENALEYGLQAAMSAFAGPESTRGGSGTALQVAAWALVLLPGAALAACLAGARVAACAAAAAAGALAALAAPFAAYALPFGAGAVQLLWPLLIVAFARQRRR